LNPTPGTGTSPTTTSTIAADISTLHRHPSIWDPDALTFRPARFDDSNLTDLQLKAYIPFSIKPHKCPAAGNAFGERMVVVLVVALGRVLGPEQGRVRFGGNGGGNGKGDGGESELLTGRGEMEGWVWEMGAL
jgi:hypothetical protein